MKKVTHEMWSGRASYRQELFGDESFLPLDDTDQSDVNHSLAALAFAMRLNISSTQVPGGALQENLTNEAVHTILEYHDQAAHGIVTGPAVFGLQNPQTDLPKVASLTSKIIRSWERSWMVDNKKQGIPQETNPTPFAGLSSLPIDADSFRRKDVQLVVETAAAACEAFQSGWPSGKIDTHEHRALASFIARRGPAFAQAWIRGDMIRSYCLEHGLDPDLWLGLVSGGRRIRIALHLPREHPLSRFQNFVAAYQTLSTEALATSLGWTHEKVDATFSSATRAHWALRTEHPFKALCRIGEYMEISEDPTKLGAYLGWSKEQVTKVFPMGFLKYIGMKYADPLGHIRAIATVYTDTLSRENIARELQDIGVSQQVVERLMMTPLRAQIAIFYSKSAMSTVRNIFAQLPDRPSDVFSELAWAWQIFHYPKPDDPRRHKSIAAYRVWKNINLRVLSANEARSSTDTRTIYDKQADSTYDPATMIGASDAYERLEQLAKQAGISSHRLDVLLSHFAEGTIDPNTTDLKDLEILRAAASPEV